MWGILLPACAVLACIAGFLFHSPRDRAKAPYPAYEESQAREPDLLGKIKRIDQAVYACLYRNGTAEKDVSFLEVRPRSRNHLIWDFTDLLIKCRDEQSALALERNIVHALANLGRGISVRKEKRPDGRIICRVHVNEFFTHKISLIYRPQQASLPKKERPKVAIIIDDLGYDSAVASSFLDLDLPLSLSVLPSAPFTDRIVREGNEKRAELMVHMPMEPKDYPSVNPGPGALLVGMSDHEISEVLQRDLKEIPGARGVNNHMGSFFTENTDKMRIVFRELKRMRMFYVDSRTTSDTICIDLAREMGVAFARRNVFLDNDLSPSAIRMQVERLLSMARHSGHAIGIGHAHWETLKILRDYAPRIKKEFEVVPVSKLVSRNGGTVASERGTRGIN